MPIATGKEGEVTIEFGLNDAVSSFRVLADVFTADGVLGSDSMQIDSVQPFYLEPKLCQASHTRPSESVAAA